MQWPPYTRAIEMADVVARLDKLEAKLNGGGGGP